MKQMPWILARAAASKIARPRTSEYHIQAGPRVVNKWLRLEALPRDERQ
jgi:hypothetical protein